MKLHMHRANKAQHVCVTYLVGFIFSFITGFLFIHERDIFELYIYIEIDKNLSCNLKSATIWSAVRQKLFSPDKKKVNI